MARESVVPEVLRPQPEADPLALVSRCLLEPRPYETNEPPPVAPSLPAKGELRVVGARIDGLTIAVRLDLDPRAVAAWHHEAVEGQGYGTVDVAMPGFAIPVPLDGFVPYLASERPASVRLQLQRVGPTAVKFQNADIHGILNEKGIGGCQLEVTFRATYLATSTVYSALAYVTRVANALGKFELWKLRRVDLAVDVAGWKHERRDAEAWVTRPRAILKEYVEMEGDDLVTYSRGAKLTGFTICPGSPIQDRCYDKREELNAQSPDKRVLEETIWRRNGWDGIAPVARNEFQLRSEALRSFNLEAPEALEQSVDALWQYLTRKWCRLVQPGTNARKSRCTLDPRWELLTMVKFQHKADPAVRSHIRRGAGAKQALGGLLSFAAAAGVRRLVVARAADPEAAATALAAEIASILAGVAPALAAELAKEHGALGALHYVHTRERLAAAKHSSAGELVLGPGPVDWRRVLGREPGELPELTLPEDAETIDHPVYQGPTRWLGEGL